MGELKLYSDHCDLQKLMKPKFAERWSCDKPIVNDKVLRNTKCKIICPDGFDLRKCKYSVPRSDFPVFGPKITYIILSLF